MGMAFMRSFSRTHGKLQTRRDRQTDRNGEGEINKEKTVNNNNNTKKED